MATPEAAPTVIHGRYRVLSIAGRGASGCVLEVEDLERGEPRALKVVAAGPHEAMLLAEFEQLARLRHPSLPRVFEVGRTREPIADLAVGAPFFVAEWIAGARCDAVPWPDAPGAGAALWTLLADVAGALATIHAAGLVHADVAPQNVLVIGSGDALDRAVLVDLGFAGDPGATHRSGLGARGTPAYMAPEALAGHVEPRSDLYGLGATVLRLVTGRPPFEGASIGELAQQIVAGLAPYPLPGVPRPLADLIFRLVARDADARPGSALAVLDELDQLAPAIAPGSARRARPPVGPPPAPGTWPGAEPWIAALDADLAAGAAIAVAGPGAAGGRALADAALRRRQLAQVARSGAVGAAGAGSVAGAAGAAGAGSVAGAAGAAGAAGVIGVIGGTLDEVARRLDVPVVSARIWLERVARAARGASRPVVIELGGDPRAAELAAALGRAPPGAHPVIALVDDAPPDGWPGVAVHRAPVLDAPGVAALARAMLGVSPPRAWAAALHAASGGLPLTAIELLRSISGERDPLAVDWSARTSAGAAELHARALGAASAGARRIAAAIAAWGGRARIDRVLATLRAADAAAPPAGLAAAGPAAAGLAEVAELERVPAGLAEVAELERAGVVRRSDTDVMLERAALDAAIAVGGEAALGHLADCALAAATELAHDAAAPDAAAPDAAAPDAAAPDAAAPDAAALDAAAPDAAAPDAAGPELLAPLLERARLDGPRAPLACAVAEQLLARGRADRALAIARRAIAVAPDRAGLLAARAAAALGSYGDAAAYARAAAAAGADPIEAALVAARAAQRAGDLDAAEAALSKLHAEHPAHAEIAGTYARLLVTRSQYARARAIAAAGGPLAGLRAEAAGLAALYQGELPAADAAFAALEVSGAAADDGATVGRALSLRGMVAQQRGQLGLAGDRYREAARRLGEVGEVHAAAVAELNLGTVLAERGRASEALPRLAAAGRVLAALGATTELIAADLNRGNALLAVGQPEEARAAALAALERAGGAPHLRAFALLVVGDARRRLGDEAGALGAYREALAIGVERGDANAQVSAYVALAEAGSPAADAAVTGVDVEALCASDDDRDRWTLARGRLALRAAAPPAGAGVGAAGAAAAHAAHAAHALLELARACAKVAARAAEADRLDRAFRGHSIAAQLAARARDPALAGAEADRARAVHAALIGATAPAFRAALDADPDLARLPGGAAPRPALRGLSAAGAAGALGAAGAADAHGNPGAPGAAGAAGALGQLAPLRRLLNLSRRLNTEASVERILDDVIDTAIELTSAERGFLLLRQPGGELLPVVSRNFTASDLSPAAAAAVVPATAAVPAVPAAATSAAADTAISAAANTATAVAAVAAVAAAAAAATSAAAAAASGASVSRSIAERAAQTGEPVVTIDAGVDERFGAAASVSALRLRSVLAVPLRQRGAIIGCVYVDHRLRGGAFDDTAAAVLLELADIAAIAIENARLGAELRRSTEEVDALAARLSAELAERDAELVRVKADLPDRDRLRHRYERIVGRSPAMLRMLEIIDRAAATALPVVIVGESGTGKELVARALHEHGPRKAGPFVAINCGAVPEPLLESELFGHVRGAFTSADRDRRGLFEVADGGTLFLDEIADTSMAMQAKLLRVLQDGVIRRVGDTRTRQVDVRVVVATQRPLAELVSAGRFREDLRFRLEVIAIAVPPLRDRDGDLPLLIEQLLARLAPGRTPPRLTRAALRVLGQHRWPGNVRELENALARGVAMGGDVIDVSDLPEAIASTAGRPEPAKPIVGDDLRLRPALAATEHAYITAAMARAKGNQTVAARLLGLSRFGLQKKLRRLAGDDAGGDAGDDADA
ncbi:MAG TPA: sigma 54-interacting transcriptional regulator [Kofleriaceae bacterium]|nr:sigma 54-interacting transcriptional regulator [Kofleriaceae bacterium]